MPLVRIFYTFKDVENFVVAQAQMVSSTCAVILAPSHCGAQIVAIGRDIFFDAILNCQFNGESCRLQKLRV